MNFKDKYNCARKNKNILMFTYNNYKWIFKEDYDKL